MAEISISGLNKAKLLAALYNGSKPQGLGFMRYNNEPMQVSEAQAFLDAGQTYFDYLKGRVMKVNLSGDMMSTAGYDRDNGTGAAEEVVKELRKTGNVNSGAIEERHVSSTIAQAQSQREVLSKKSASKIGSEGLIISLGFDEFASPLEMIFELVEMEFLFAEKSASDVVRRGWYMVKKNPKSAGAKSIAGQMVTVESFDRKKETVAVFTASTFFNKSGVAIRLLVTDLADVTLADEDLGQMVSEAIAALQKHSKFLPGATNVFKQMLNKVIFHKQRFSKGMIEGIFAAVPSEDIELVFNAFEAVYQKRQEMLKSV